jgi:hypothetical protein
MKKIIALGAWLIAALITPISHSQEISTMSADDTSVSTEQSLINRHFEIWNDRNADVRLTKFATLYTADFTVADYAATAIGYPAVNQLIDRVLTQHQGFQFSPEPVAWNHGVGRVRWGFGPKENPNQVRGEDIFTVRDGKLATMHVFIDSK